MSDLRSLSESRNFCQKASDKKLNGMANALVEIRQNGGVFNSKESDADMLLAIEQELARRATVH